MYNNLDGTVRNTHGMATSQALEQGIRSEIELCREPVKSTTAKNFEASFQSGTKQIINQLSDQSSTRTAILRRCFTPEI